MNRLKNYQKDFDQIEQGKFEYLGRNQENNNKLVIKCNKCRNIFSLNWQMLQKNGFKCPNCEITHKTQKKTFEQYWKEFKAAGLDVVQFHNQRNFMECVERYYANINDWAGSED